MKIAFQGEHGAFSELAAIEHFGPSAKLMAKPEFPDVFKAVASGECHYGVVPIENSLAGSIHQNYDLLLESNLFIAGEILLRIGHFLISNRGVKKSQVKRVFSHPQALAQCKKYLNAFTGTEKIPYSNTALAVKKIRDEGLKDAAAIASIQAAIDFKMDVLASNIEDNKWNTTRFLVVAKKSEKPSGNLPLKSSVVFSMKNIPGALFKCLGAFALRDIDLFKIESRPVHGKGFKYLFYLDFEGSPTSDAQRNALANLQEITRFYRFLGSYPQGKPVQPKYGKR